MAVEGGKPYTIKEDGSATIAEATIGKNGENLASDVVSMKVVQGMVDNEGRFKAPGAQNDNQAGDEAGQEGTEEVAKGDEGGAEDDTAGNKGTETTKQVTPAGEPAGVVDDPEITIGGVKKKYSELVSEAADDIGADLNELPPDSVKKIVDGYIARKHDTAWKKNNTVRSEEVAAARKVNEQREVELKKRQADLDAQARYVAGQKERILKEETRLKAIVAKAIPKDEVMDSEGNILNGEKFTQYTKVEQARERLAELNEERKEVEHESAQSDTDRIVNSVELFQATTPQYQMSKSFAESVGRFQGVSESDDPDFVKFLEIRDIAEYAATRKLSLEAAYQHFKRQGKLAVKGEDLPALPEATSQQSGVEKVVNGISRKQQVAGVPSPAGASATRRSVRANVPLGDKLREASQRAMGGTRGRTK